MKGLRLLGLLLLCLLWLGGCSSGSRSSQQISTVPSVAPAITIQVTPTAPTLGPGTSQTFTAVVLGSTNTAVTWSVQEAGGGAITPQGTYSAPATAGTFHVIATSQADTAKSAVVAVVIAPIVVTVTPATETLGPLSPKPFTAVLTASSSSGVHWSVAEGAPGGVIDDAGHYTAPTQTGIAHVVASSAADPSRTGAAIVTIVPSGFRPTGYLTSNRASATATLLRDGKVLILGGESVTSDNGCGGSDTPISQAEMYDPASGSFAQAASLQVGRTLQTATLLNDGRVLVAGGSNSSSAPLASAEIYDPATGAFMLTGSMLEPRVGQSATLLQNGKVLIAGGTDTTAAEIYDPANGTFTATGNMVSPRSSHTATLLANGKVLIAGGGSLQTAELYDPAAGTFVLTGSMEFPRNGHTATLLADRGRVLIAGGGYAAGALSSAEIYDVLTGTFAATGSMANPRVQHTATLLASGQVVITGGFGAGVGAGPLATAELFDPLTSTFTQTGSMVAPRSSHAAALLPDGKTFLVAGGSGISGVTMSTAEIYH
jgi:Galactose oxidase, central domain/Kelch motif